MIEHTTIAIRRSQLRCLRLHTEFDEAFASTQLPEGSEYVRANELLLKEGGNVEPIRIVAADVRRL
jgi:hypothetical protein